MISFLFSAFLILNAAPPTPLPTPAVDEHFSYWARTLQSHPLQLVRKNAARMLGTLGDRQAVPILIGALKDPFYGTRVEAARSLGVLGDENGISPLTDASRKDSDGQVRKAASDAVEKIKAYQEFQKKKLEKLKAAESAPGR